MGFRIKRKPMPEAPPTKPVRQPLRGNGGLTPQQPDSRPQLRLEAKIRAKGSPGKGAQTCRSTTGVPSPHSNSRFRGGLPQAPKEVPIPPLSPEQKDFLRRLYDEFLAHKRQGVSPIPLSKLDGCSGTTPEIRSLAEMHFVWFVLAWDPGTKGSTPMWALEPSGVVLCRQLFGVDGKGGAA